MSKLRGLSLRFKALIVLGIVLGSALGFGGGYLVGATTALGSWSGNYFTEAYGNFTSGLRLPFTTSGRVLVAGSGGAVANYAGLIYDSTHGLSSSTWLNATQGIKDGTLTSGRPIVASAGGVLTSSSAALSDAFNKPESTASYLMWVDGGVYYLRDGHTGQVTSEANSTTLLQSVINLSAGKTIICKGSMSFSGNIILNKDIMTLIFDTFTFSNNKGIIINGNSRNINLYGNNLILSSAFTGKAIDISSSTSNFIKINYIYHLGAIQAGSAALHIGTGASWNEIIIGKTYQFGSALLIDSTGTRNNIKIIQISAPNYAIYLHATTVDLKDNKIEILSIESTVQDGLYLYADSKNIYSNEIILGQVITSNYSIHLKSNLGFGVYSNLINVNHINSYGTNAIRIENSGSSGNNIISGPCAINAGTKTVIYNNNTNNEILENINVSDVTSGKAVENSGKLTCIGTQWDTAKVTNTGTIFYDGHWDSVLAKTISKTYPLTENGAIATILIHTSSITINHGLSYTPALSDFSLTYGAGGTQNCTSVSVTSITSTQATFSCLDSTGTAKWCSGAITIGWNAQKIP